MRLVLLLGSLVELLYSHDNTPLWFHYYIFFFLYLCFLVRPGPSVVMAVFVRGRTILFPAYGRCLALTHHRGP